MNPLQISVSIQILKPIHEVFEGIVDPAKMSNYFISKSSGRMEENTKLIWNFSEFNLDFPVYVKQIEKDKYISYVWNDYEDGRELLVEMTLIPTAEDKTLLKITEKGHDSNEKGIKWLQGNTEGWANFCASLKAYLEYGINLRKGAFDYRKEEFDK
jgi:uncharacterized protein YndB with AHSA1/START domain